MKLSAKRTRVGPDRKWRFANLVLEKGEEEEEEGEINHFLQNVRMIDHVIILHNT